MSGLAPAADHIGAPIPATSTAAPRSVHPVILFWSVWWQHRLDCIILARIESFYNLLDIRIWLVLISPSDLREIECRAAICPPNLFIPGRLENFQINSLTKVTSRVPTGLLSTKTIVISNSNPCSDECTQDSTDRFPRFLNSSSSDCRYHRRPDWIRIVPSSHRIVEQRQLQPNGGRTVKPATGAIVFSKLIPRALPQSPRQQPSFYSRRFLSVSYLFRRTILLSMVSFRFLSANFQVSLSRMELISLVARHSSRRLDSLSQSQEELQMPNRNPPPSHLLIVGFIFIRFTVFLFLSSSFSFPEYFRPRPAYFYIPFLPVSLRSFAFRFLPHLHFHPHTPILALRR